MSGKGDWFNFIEVPIDNTLTSILGEDIGGFLGSNGLGQEIENWTSPTKMLSDRNPLWKMATGDYKFADQEGKWYDELGNNMTKLAALLYAGGSAAGGSFGGGATGEGAGSGLGELAFGGNEAIATGEGAGAGLGELGTGSIGDFDMSSMLGGDVTSSTPFYADQTGGFDWMSLLDNQGSINKLLGNQSQQQQQQQEEVSAPQSNLSEVYAARRRQRAIEEEQERKKRKEEVVSALSGPSI